MLRRQKENLLVLQFRDAIKEAYKKKNIPRLNDILETILCLVAESQDFRIKNRYFEPRPNRTKNEW